MRPVKTTNLSCWNEEGYEGRLTKTADIFFPARQASSESRSDGNAGFPFKIQTGFNYD